MVMGHMRKYKKIDPELCFKVWAETGSLYNVGEVLMTKHHLFNVKSGKPYSIQGIWRAAGMYVIENLPEARKIFTDVWRANGIIIDDKAWYTYVWAKLPYLPIKRQEQFKKDHAYMIPYVQEK
jgi:hypothetical protein